MKGWVGRAGGRGRRMGGGGGWLISITLWAPAEISQVAMFWRKLSMCENVVAEQLLCILCRRAVWWMSGCNFSNHETRFEQS